MSGHVSGVDVIIKKEVSSMANYIFCYNHRLNLVEVYVFSFSEHLIYFLFHYLGHRKYLLKIAWL